ncbi:hypothetical protein LDO31_06420 [Luteimonas sp. XNQY3]|nr:hypothetical protein [Luteimonas sp. XNQY3]MCD9005875.1 hypothetical protein [Luteimonas sp. XNQY3]
MMHRPGLLALALALALAGAIAPVPASASAENAALQRLVGGQRLDIAETGRLYRQAVLDGDGVDALYRRLDAMAQSAGPAGQRAMALLAKADMQWRQGLAAQALADVDRALSLSPSADAWLLKARLLDAQGDVGAAAAWYAKACDASHAPDEQAFLQLRLAIAGAQDRPGALAELARQWPQASANRLAPVVALLGQRGQAVGIQRVDGRGEDAYRQHVRVADWARAAGEHAVAREHAWSAFAAAGDAAGQRYALALLAESYRDADDLAGAAAFLAARPQLPEVAQARVDALLELGRYDEAIAIVRRSGDADLRQRLLGILDIAGRDSEVEAEYRRLIARQPHRAEWYDGLAALYMRRGEDAQALAVYAEAFAANRGRIDALIAAARQMIAMGLEAPALEMMGEAANDPAFAVPVGFFLFETRLKQGQDAEARQVLARLQALVPADSALLVDVAEGYERLRQPDQALAVLVGLEARRGGLDYDRQVHIANLAFATGRLDESLSRWRRLWAQTQLPARRSYLERQIVKVATRLGRLEQLAADIETRLASGPVSQSEVNLLVGLHLAAKDRQAAEAAVETYAERGGLGEAEKLAQLGTVYARLEDYDNVDRSLRRLSQVDPDNADLYLRRLTLNALRNGDEDETADARLRKVDGLLRELNAVSGPGGAPSAPFAAGVYAMAGLDEQAIDRYRDALAQAPGDADHLLQLVALLKRQQRHAEAAALLQHAAEHPVEADGFIAAIDGLIDLFAADGNARVRQSGQAQLAADILPWAQRRVLERIARDGDDLRLYSLLADLAQEQADFGLQLRAYEESLALSDAQRPEMLRQLVALSSGAGPAGDGSGPALGDNRRKAAYGRRLLALKREYPPELYADLAGSLLAEGDVTGAERAFAMMGDIGGLVNVDRIKAETYAGAGHADKALANYARALLRDQDDLELAVKTAVLREQRGQEALANHGYWKALRTAILRQPLRGNDAGRTGDADWDSLRHYPSLVEGLLLTWPAQADGQQRILADLRRLSDDALAQVDAAGPGALATWPRLELIVGLQRRIAEYLGDPAWLDPLESALDRHFAGDPDARAARDYQRRLAGLQTGQAARSGHGDWVAQGLRVQAGDTGNFDLSLALAIADGDRAALARLTETALAAEAAWQATAGDPPVRSRPEQLYRLLVETLDRLPPEMFAERVLAPLQRSPSHDAMLFDLFRTSPDRYRRLAAMTGRPPLDDETLLRMLVAHGDDPLPQRAAGPHGRAADLADAVIASFPLDRLLDLYAGLVERMQAGGNESALQARLVEHVFRQPMDPAQQARLSAALERDIGYRPAGARARLLPVVQKLLLPETAEANRPLLLEAAHRAAAHHPDARHLPAFLEAWFAGDASEAFESLLALRDDGRSTGPGRSGTADLVGRYFADERRRRVDAFLAAGAPSAEAAARFYRDFVFDQDDARGQGDAAEAVRLYRKLLSVDGGNTVYLAGLLGVHWRQGEHQAFADLLRGHVDAHPDDADAATILQLAYRLLRQPQQAQAVARASGVDVGDAEWLAQSINKARASQPGTLEPDFGPLFTQVYAAYEAANPDDAAVVEVKRRSGNGPGRSGDADAGLRPLAEAFADAPDSTPGILRGLWREGIPGAGMSSAGALPRQILIDVRFDLEGRPARSGPDGADDAVTQRIQSPGGGGPDLLASMAALPQISDEYERYLRGLEPQARQRQQRLYDLLAQGLVAQGTADARLQGLLRRLHEGDIGGHELQLLATLADRLPRVLDPGQLQALAARLRQMPVLAANQRILLARLFAAGQDHASAGALLQAATMQVLYPEQEDLRGARYVRDMAVPPSLADIVSDLGRWRDRDAARRVHAAIVERIGAERIAASNPALRSAQLPPFPENP